MTGKQTYDNGDYYCGDFRLNTMCGRGKLYNSRKQKIYSGDWFNNQFHGKGKYYFTTGNVQFDGNWCQSLAHGIGIRYDNDGTIKQFGIYEDGIFVKDLVEDIYFVLQCYVQNENYYYTLDSSNNLVLEQDVIDWVNQHYKSPHSKPQTKKPTIDVNNSLTGVNNSIDEMDSIETITGMGADSDEQEEDNDIKSTIVDIGPVPRKQDELQSTTNSVFESTRESFATIPTKDINKHNVIKNLLY